jgi:hypothetical protein
VVTLKAKAAMEALTKARLSILEISKQIVVTIRPYKLQVEEGPEGHALPLGRKNAVLIVSVSVVPQRSEQGQPPFSRSIC